MPRRYTGSFISGTEQLTDANKANGIFTVQEAGALTAAGNFPTNFTPTRSVRFRDSVSSYLSKVVTYPGSQTTWTFSTWFKPGKPGTASNLFGAQIDGSNQSMFSYRANTYLQFYTSTAGSQVASVVWTDGVFRDPAAWYHTTLVWDSTHLSSTRRLRCYVNGVELVSISGTAGENAFPAQNALSQWNGAMSHSIGRRANNSEYFNGYMAETIFVDGQALPPSSFAMTHPSTGSWIPKPYSGTYGGNGFYLPYNTDTTAYTANILVVGGGGAGASFIGGGGGGGGFMYYDIPIVPSNSMVVTVGAGGPVDTSGSSSKLGSYIAAGGGKGGGYEVAGSAGGSGGGGGGTSGAPASYYAGGATLYFQGNVGGTTPQQAIYGASGGGGAGGAGGNSPSTSSAGNGGAGNTWPINSVLYAGGGGGGTRSYNTGNGGDGGSGGGGHGGGVNHIPGPGLANRGGGSGGNGFVDGHFSLAGGSGVVIIRVPDTQTLTFSAGVTVSGGTPSGGYKTYTVTATSTTSETVTFS
jgi:hypothetical protein